MTSSIRSMSIAISFMALSSCKHNAPSSKAKDITHKDELRDKYATIYSDKGQIFFKKCLPESESFDRNCQVDGAIADKSTEDFEKALPEDIQLRNRILCHLKQGSDFVSSTPPPAISPVAEKCKSFGPITSDDLVKAFGVFNYSISPPTTNPGAPPATNPPGGGSIAGMNFIPIQGQSFAIQETEVTRGQWKALMNYYPEAKVTSCTPKVLVDDQPVSCVSSTDAELFADEMNRKNDGHTYRLPTEQEWATAAGDIGGPVYGWCNSSISHPVKKLKAQNGLYDMAGNVWEWTSSYWDGKEGRSLVTRGGGWNDYECHTAIRIDNDLGDRYTNLGFRLLRTPSP